MNRQNPIYSKIESELSELLRQRTGYDLQNLDRDATFLELGFDSLFLIQFSQELRQRFGVKVTFRQLIEEVTSVDKLLDQIVSLLPPAPVTPIASTPVPPKPPSPPSNAATTEAQETMAKPSVASVPPSIQAVPVTAPATSVLSSQPASTSMQNVAPMQVSMPVAMPVPVVPMNGTVSGIEQIILQQNALMMQHLSLLSNQPMAYAVPTLAPQMVPAVPATCDDVLCQDKHTPCQQSAAFAMTQPASTAASALSTRAPTAPARIASPSAPAVSTDSAPTVTKHERFGPYKPVRRGPGNSLTDQQKTHLSHFMDRYVKRTTKSRALAEANRSHFADPRGVAGYRRIWKSMVYQIAVEKSKGSKLWDIDGNEYVDIAMGFGLNLFGQSPDFLTKAFHEQLDRGVEVGPQSPIAGEVAKLLCEFARKDRATFCCTGSEAVMAALRLSRTVTGKSKFVFFNKDYHGNFDQVLVRSNLVGTKRVTSPAAPGVPQSFADNAIVLDYGTQEALDVIRERADEIAAVLIEPVQSANPFLQPKEFLHEIRQITRDKNIAMIMDEVITGFRAAQGGAQEWFGVWADMSTYGKILGGGLPIGALAGTREYMDALDGGMWKYEDDSEPEADMTFFAGTFVRHPLAIVAAHQVLLKVKEEGPELQRRLTDRTTYLVETLNAFFEQEQFPIRVAQFASQFRFMFPADLEYADMLYFHMLDRGIFTRGWGDNCFLSTAHSDEDVEKVIRGVQESCLEIRRGGFFPDAVGPTEVMLAEKKNSPTHVSSQPNAPVANQLMHAVQAESYTVSNLVEIQPEGSRTPLFCTPAADGLTLVYHELSDHLGEDQPVYGLNSPGVLGLPIPDTLEELAANMIREMREVQPKGPYLLAGYCSGGTTALEIARQLVNEGEQVAMLAMIETYNWLTAPSTNPSFLTKVSYERQRIEFHVRNFLLLDWANKKEFLASKWSTARRRVKVWRDSMSNLFAKNKTRRPAALVNMADIWLKHDQIAEKYVPRFYPGRLIHFRPQRDYKCHLGTEVEGREVEYYRMKSYPAGIMVKPFVAELATCISREIDRGLAEAASRTAVSIVSQPREAVEQIEYEPQYS
ncbi:aminotransferase class III-fold pyridoxal phosphate-dependent enzyme [Pirellulaceae bacterium SH449]